MPHAPLSNGLHLALDTGAVNWSMFEAFLLLYGVVIVAGSWLMLVGVAEAPVGYEDEEGFHFAEEEGSSIE